MHGFEQGIGGFLGSGGDRVLGSGGHLEPLGIVALVLGLILWAVVVTTLALVIAYLVRRLRTPGNGPARVVPQTAAVAAPAAQPAATGVQPVAAPEAPAAGSDALGILEERYARGEIDQSEYQSRKAELTGQA